MDAKRIWRRGVAAGGIVGFTLVAAACQIEVGTGGDDASDEETADEIDNVDGEEVSDQVSEALAEEVGQTPDDVECPDLPREIDAVVRCELTAGPDTLGVTVTVTEVEGERIDFDIKVDETMS